MNSSRARFTDADRAVLASTRALIEQVRDQTNLAYADDDWSPISDITVGAIAKEMGAGLLERRMPDAIQEMGLPAIFGPPLLAVNSNAPIGLRRIALRHGLAHLVAGELDPEAGVEIRFMSSAFDWMTLEERRADLFAIADLIPDRLLAPLRAAEYSADELLRWIYCEIARYAPAWPTERLADRAGLRLALTSGVS